LLNVAATHLKGGKSSPEREAVIKKIGQWRYICDELADFNAILSDQFYDTPHHIVARAWVAKRTASYIPETKGR
jgi:hypothetical protein